MVSKGLLSMVVFALYTASAQQTGTDSEQLQSAVSKGHRLGSEERGVSAVDELLNHGLNVNAKDSAGWTALMMASLEGLPKVVEILLKRGADPNVRSKKGETALIIAAGCFIVRTRAELVAERGFGPDMRLQQLNAPQLMVEALIRRGADVNAATLDGRTSIMSAAMHGWVEVARALIVAKSNVNAKDNEERIAVDYARPDDRPMLDALRAAGSLQGSRHSGRTLCDAQAVLNQLNLRSGIPDCWWGTSTANALREFQKQRGLRVSGELDGPTMDALKVRR